MRALANHAAGVRGGRNALRSGGLLGAAGAALLLAACGDPPIASYRIPKEKAPAPAEAPVAAAESDAPPALRWKVPGSWRPLAAGQMQLARFAVEARGDARAEVSVSVFASETGGPLGNVNRWRGQLGLGPVSEAELPRQASPLDPAAPGSLLVNLTNGDRQLVAAIVPRGGQWYFYKLLGDAAAVGPQIEAFTAFAKSEP